MIDRRREPGTSALLLLCAAVLLAGIFGACGRREPSRFPHRVHLAAQDCGAPGQPSCLRCTSCHEVSGQADARVMPEPALCDRCHRDRPETKAVLAVAPLRPYGEIAIDHDRHLALPAIRGQCVPCHAGVVDTNRPALPPMSQCFTCHTHQAEWDRGQCTPCHQERDLPRLVPVTFLKHDAGFMRRHGEVMAQSKQGALCQSCHTQAQCQACHDITQDMTVEARRPERIESRQVHRADFLVRHAIEARAEPARCLSCHTEDTCSACHTARGVSGTLLGNVNPHPPEWVGTNTSSSNFHGPAARRDILSCAGCHEAGPATNCIRCHQVGAYGGNPHPRGWQSSRGVASEMCRYCHG